MNISCTCSLSRVRARYHAKMFVFTCRCSSAERTVLSTSTATGPATRKDSATCLANSGLVGERLILHPIKLLA